MILKNAKHAKKTFAVKFCLVVVGLFSIHDIALLFLVSSFSYLFLVPMNLNRNNSLCSRAAVLQFEEFILRLFFA